MFFHRLRTLICAPEAERCVEDELLPRGSRLRCLCGQLITQGVHCLDSRAGEVLAVTCVYTLVRRYQTRQDLTPSHKEWGGVTAAVLWVDRNTQLGAVCPTQPVPGTVLYRLRTEQLKPLI